MAVAEALEIGIGDLIPKLLAHADVLFGSVQAAGAVPFFLLQAVADHLHDLLIFVECDLHSIISSPYFFLLRLRCFVQPS